MLLLHEGFSLFINGEAKPSSIQILDPQKTGSHPKILMNQRSMISTAASP